MGELMIIHQCCDCYSISINRIAADDDVQKILEIMEESLMLREDQLELLRNSGIGPVSHPYFEQVREQLLGKTLNFIAALNLSV